jgi:acyl dehydratase
MAAEREEAKLEVLEVEVEPAADEPEVEAPSVVVAGDTLRGSASCQKKKKNDLEYVYKIDKQDIE